MAYWLLKTEPTTYSFADLVREKSTPWSGITNALALQHLRRMKKGDDVLIYHTGKEKAVVGTAKIVKGAYAEGADEKRVVVDVAAGKALRRAVTLAEIKADRRLKEWGLVTFGRLSVVPTTEDQYAFVIAMAKDND